MSCHLTRTTAATHRLIQENLEETPVYGGWVDSKGPRYCPSIEDKIVRFKDKDSHQVGFMKERVELVLGRAISFKSPLYLCRNTSLCSVWAI